MDSKKIVGIIIILILILGFIFLFTLKHLFFYEITLQFRDTNGLKTGDPVYSKGVELGRVKKIILLNDKVNVILNIKNSYKNKIPVDSKFYIKTDTFILGKKCIYIKMGNSPRFLKNKDFVNCSNFLDSIKKWFKK